MLLKFYRICASRQVIILKKCLAKEKVNIVFASTTNGVFVFLGIKKMPTMWKSWIITNLLYNDVLFAQEYQNG